MTGRRRGLGAVVSTSIVVALAACGGGAAAGEVGSRLPDVEIVELGGDGTLDLGDIEGPAVVNLWATWCAPCRAEIPDFEAVHRARGSDVRFIGVNIGEDAGRAADFVTRVGATYEQFRDPDGVVVTALHTTAMPVTIVVDGEGLVTTRHLGPMDTATLDDALDDALAAG